MGDSPGKPHGSFTLPFTNPDVFNAQDSGQALLPNIDRVVSITVHHRNPLLNS